MELDEICENILTLSMVICCGFLFVTNVLFVSHFGQKHLLNALNVNVNVNVVDFLKILFVFSEMLYSQNVTSFMKCCV